MTTRRSLSVRTAAALVVPALFGAFPARGADESRLVEEARVLFRVVRSDAVPTEKCSLNADWDRGSIPESIARKHFKLSVHADIRAPWVLDTVESIIGDVKTHPEIVCNSGEIRTYIEDRRIAFKSGSADRSAQTSLQYSMPIFDDNYQTAAVIVTAVTETFFRLKAKNDANRIFGEIGLVRYAAIYKRSNGEWKLETTEVLEIS